MFQALRLRDFRLLSARSLALPWLLAAGHSHPGPRPAGRRLAARHRAHPRRGYLPLLILGPVAGVAADLRDRRRLLVTAGLFCAGAVAMMLLGTSPGRYWVLYLALIAENSGTVLSVPPCKP